MTTAAQARTIFVNDRQRPLFPGASLLGIVKDLGLAERKGVAIAVNGSIIPRADWPARALADADRILVIQATQGG